MKSLLIAVNAKYIHTNLAIRYLYTYTNEEHDIDFIEFTIKDSITNIKDEILKSKPDLIGFSCYIWNIEIIKELVQIIKKENPTIKILLGGPEVSYEYTHWFETLPIDYLIFGEGEEPFKQLLTCLKNNLPLDTVPQLHYKLNNKLHSNFKEYILDLTTLPNPYKLKRDEASIKNRIQYIESSRGCPYRCSYCLASLEKHVRFIPLETVQNQIRDLMKRGAKTFKFLDRTFNVRKDYALTMFEFIINEHCDGSVFQFEITGDLLDEEIIHYLNEYAPKDLIRFEIGIQSTNELTNQLILRTQNFEKLKHNVLLIQKGDKIDLHLDLIAGLPKEDYPSFMKTFNDVFSLKPHELQLGFLKMLRGTKIRREAENYHYEYHELAPYEIISHDDLSKEDVHNIHLAEEMLEKYYNSHRFDTSINYIISTYYKENNYQFFEKFGRFYNKHYSFIQYQYHDLCLRLLKFMKEEKINDPNIESLLIYDYLKNQKTRPKKWYYTPVTKEENHKLFPYVIEHINNKFTLDLLFRYSVVELLTINPLTYEKGNYYLLKLFAPMNKDIYIIKKSHI